MGNLASMKDIENLRIHFYGVQGSGSIYPSLQDRQAYRKVTDCELLHQVFTNLQQRTGPEGRLNATIEELIGGPLNRKTLEAYRAQFDMPTARIYGGWTTCIRIETADGFDIVLDCGSGFRVCAKDIVKKWRDLEGDGQVRTKIIAISIFLVATLTMITRKALIKQPSVLTPVTISMFMRTANIYRPLTRY